MEIEILAKFCHEDREPINRVIVKGGFAWVTDGNIGIRAATNAPDSEDLTFLDKMVAAIDAHVERAATLWEDLPTPIPMREGDCPDCAGTGKQQACPSCGGDGEIELTHHWHGGSHDYTVECEECDGTGSTGGQQDGEGGCLECGKTGKVQISEAVAFGPAWIDSFLLHRIAILPGPIQICHGASPLQQIPIRGDGWIGVLMPMREHGTKVH